MPKAREVAAHVVTFGSMTAAAIVVIALIVLADDGDSQVPTTQAVIANQDIATGMLISENMLNIVNVPEQKRIQGAYADTGSVVGEVATVNIAKGEQLTAAKIVPHVDPAATGLSPSKRAFSFSTESATIDGQPINPGQRVDLVIEREGAATTMVEDVAVLSVALEIQRHASPLGRESPSPPTITVAVEVEEVRLLGEALEAGGKLRLARPA